MKKISAIIMTFMCMVNMSLAQSQQLKTLHHLQGEEDRTGLTYTGYEDELGNIVRHGAFTYQNDGIIMSLNYKNDKLDNDASIVYTTPKFPTYKLSCKMKYKDGKLLEINYEENGEYDGYRNKVYPGKTIFKYAQNEQGLPKGEFECTLVLSSYDNEYVKGQFDNSGKATGNWKLYANFASREEDELHPNQASFGEMGSEVYFEKGYCLGANEKSISLGRQYLIEESLSEQELNDKGFYFEKDAIEVKYGLIGDGSASGPRMFKESLQEMAAESAKRMRNIVYNTLYYGQYGQNYRLFNGLYGLCPPINLNCNFKGAFENGSVQGEPIMYMSKELCQKFKTNPSSLNYDKNTKKYYIVKVDGKSRLYVPAEFEGDFKSLWSQQEKEKQNAILKKEIAEMTEKAKSLTESELNNNMQLRGRYMNGNLEKFRPILSYNIDGTYIPDSECSYSKDSTSVTIKHCYVLVTINRKIKDEPGYETYKTEAYTDRWKIIEDFSFIKAEKIENIWDTIKNLKNTLQAGNEYLQSGKNKNVYPTVIMMYNKEGITCKSEETDPQKQLEYYTTAIGTQNKYLRFIHLARQIDTISDKIVIYAKEEKDIDKSYQEARKTWSMDVKGDITNEVKRLENYLAIQDSCMTFIELRKTITQNNAKIASFSKTAPTIVKAYFTYMKGVDLTWNQEAGRNQAVLEIIRTQDALLKALSQPNISEIDKTVKKSKAKSWEDVKKIVLLH